MSYFIHIQFDWQKLGGNSVQVQTLLSVLSTTYQVGRQYCDHELMILDMSKVLITDKAMASVFVFTLLHIVQGTLTIHDENNNPIMIDTWLKS